MGGYSSHHFNEADGFKRELARRGREFVLLVNRSAQPDVVAKLNARAVLDEDPTFRLEWSFEERSKRFLKMLHRRVDGLVRRDDCVMLTIATQLEAHALTRWLSELPRRKKPWIVILFLSDRWNRSTREEYARQVAEFTQVRSAIASAEEPHRLIFCTVTASLAAELSQLLGVRPDVVETPLPFSDARVTISDSSSVPRVAILGGTRREKGSYLIPDIVRACRDVEFIVQLTNNTLTPDEVATLARVAYEPHVTTIREAMTKSDYEAMLDRADIGLFPYEVIPYRQRTSGVFGEMVARGKPAVVTPGTWMAEQIENGRAAGVIAEDVTAEAFARAIARCVAELPALRERARVLSEEWRRGGVASFLDYVDAQIANRQRS